MPIYKVEAYLDECLASLRAQTYQRLEIIVVDDGSPDGSTAIAERHATQDPRIRVISRANGGLGAARNTGIKHARGDYYFFVDSDDVVPSTSIARMVAAATATGSDMVIGAAVRFDSKRKWRPTWFDLHTEERLGIHVKDYPGIIRNNYTWGKLYRAVFWRKCGLWFREGVAYEDQPIITQLYVRAASIDVLTDITYQWRLREDTSSISQQTHTVSDLRDRMSAWAESHEALVADAPPDIYNAWLKTLFNSHFHWYLNNKSTVDDEYWRLLRTTIAQITDSVPAEVVTSADPHHRVAIELARTNQRDAFHEFKRLGGYAIHNFATELVDAGLRFKLPTYGETKLGLPDELYLLPDERIPLVHRLDRAAWTGDEALQVEGWAYFRYVDLSSHATQIWLELRHDRTGELARARATENPARGFFPPLQDKWANYEAGAFVVELPVRDLVDRSQPRTGDTWTLFVQVETDRLSRTVAVTKVHPGGSVGTLAPVHLDAAFLHRPDGTKSRRFKLQYLQQLAAVDELSFDSGQLCGRLTTEAEVTGLSFVNTSTRASVDCPVELTQGRFSLRLPDILADIGDGVARRIDWSLRAQLASGRSTLVTTPHAALEGLWSRHGDGDVIFTTEQSYRGALILRAWRCPVEISHVRYAEEVLHLSGRAPGIDGTRVTFMLEGVKASSEWVTTHVQDGAFEIAVPLRHNVWRYGSRPLPVTTYTVITTIELPNGETRSGPAQVSERLTRWFPDSSDDTTFAVTLTCGTGRSLHLQLTPPVGPQARGSYCRNMQEQRHLTGAGAEPLDGLFIESNFGEIAGCNGVAVQKELQRRGSRLPVYWSVKDHSVVVPDGGIPVVRNSPEWFTRLSSAKYLIVNMYQPRFHKKVEGQVIIETFHGYPFKQMGQPHWKNMQFSQALVESYISRAKEWDYLVSPARYATPLLTRDFVYDGEVLEVGYPRNDVLLSDDAPKIRAATRASLGLSDSQTAILYAPTFRDYLSEDDHRASMGDFFDAAALSETLGPDYVILIRGHAFHARTNERPEAADRIVDVTDYPDPADLYLAADLAVLDYSSLRFDFAVTGKPMLFLVPDLDLYQDTRGWLLDYPPTAPGPLLSSTAEVAAAIARLGDVVDEYGAAYDTFRKEFIDLEDGRSAQRLVDAVFVPRGDAPTLDS